MDEDTSTRDYRKRIEIGKRLVKEEVKIRVKLVTDILRKENVDKTIEDQMFLDQCPDVVEEVLKKMKKRSLQKEREKEIEDPSTVVFEKALQLTQMLQRSKYAVVYTGAGISTAASIPDYRGPKGVWTMLQKGLAVGPCDASVAEPTLTHMALAQLYRKSIISHVVSQNCDGLHLRSGLPRPALSEVHGNMYIEVCKRCRPHSEYIRLFDVTEKTSLRRHKTGRKCYKCNHDLVDTIVHFGERGTLKSPLNWSKAIKTAKQCDLILCLGSSLKVLKKYTCLWGMDRSLQNRPKLCIINLQWTPKDHLATLKINGHCDEIIKIVMEKLNIPIPFYTRSTDPLFRLAVPIRPDELLTTTKKELERPPKATGGKRKRSEGSRSVTRALPSTEKCKNEHDPEEPSGTKVLQEDKDSEISKVNESSENEVPVNSEIKETPEDEKPQVNEDNVQISGLSNPGWFGKGYRKTIKRRKKRRVD